MSLNSNSTVNYNDFSSLSRLRVDARKDSDAALKEVAKQFESVFVQMMIKSMREASVPLQGELFHSNQSKAYTDMYDKQLGLELSKNNGIGLADVIVRQLSKPQSAENKTEQPAQGISVNQLPAFNPKTEKTEEIIGTNNFHNSTESVSVNKLNQNFTLDVTETTRSPHWNTPEDFIRDSWPHAQRAGKELGVDPRVILAQSALETGWGKKVHATENGESSYSLFGIKANKGWQGKTVSFSTLEFNSGSMNREIANFRAYDSLSDSYQDYVHFLKDNPRYTSIFEAESSAEFSKALQQSGYATDPDYANKIERIRKGDLMNDVLSGLKVSVQEPLT